MTKSLASSRPRRASLAIAVLLNIGVAGWLSLELMTPTNGPDTSDAQEGKAVAMSAPDAVTLPLASPDAATSLLGTASSLSAKELTLVLVATSPGRTPREGTASLGTDPRNPQTYAAGATLVNGAVIEEVHVDHVVLELGGKRSVLGVTGKPVDRRLAQQIASADQTALTVGGAAVVARPLDTVASSREDLSEFIRPEPFYERDKFSGLKVLPGRNRSRLDALGLRSGDIIRTIEGKAMRSADAGWQTLHDALSTGTTIVVSVERDGNLMSIYLDASKLAQDPVQVSTSVPLPGSPGT